MKRFSREQENALLLLLPAGLRNFTGLKELSINHCPSISSLPNDGLPKLLQELNVRWCSNQELKQQWRGLMGTIPKVMIDF